MRKVYVVGLGPGDSRCLTAEARSALDEAHVLCGYGVYVDLVAPLYPEKEVFTTPMTQELERCRWALESARSGRTTALVCSGDAGVYGMAGPLLELARDYPEVEVAVVCRGSLRHFPALRCWVRRWGTTSVWSPCRIC